MNERIREIALRFFEGTITAEEEVNCMDFSTEIRRASRR